MKKSEKIPDRIESFSEGIDDESVGIAFAKIQKLPPFIIIRRIILKYLFKPKLGDSPKSDGNILDFGCGTGDFLIALNRKIQKEKLSINLHGLDISSEMIDKCNRNLLKKKIDNVCLVEGDGIIIPFSEDYFSNVITNLSLHHWTNPVEIFSEIFRVIQPGGSFIIFDFHRTANKFWYFFLKMVTKIFVFKALRRVNEPYGSLMASYTFKEVLELINQTPWKNYPIHVNIIGPFMFIEILKGDYQ